MMTTMTSRQFNQDASGAKRAARNGPVFITDRGEPAHVLLTIGEYRRLTKARVLPERSGGALLEMLAMPGPESDFDFEPPRLGDELFRAAD